MNRHAIALAADSAVTIGQHKVWKTANKLYSLGPHHDIAVMIHGSGEYLAFAWEVAVKQYRKQSIGKTFSTLQQCADDFLQFLASDLFAAQEAQDASVLYPMMDIVSAINDKTQKDGKDRTKNALSLVGAVRSQFQKKQKLFDDLKPEEFTAHFSDLISALVENWFGKDTSDELEAEVLQLAFEVFQAKDPTPYASGVVVAGFGRDEFFPCLQHFHVDGRFGKWVRAWPARDPRSMAPDQNGRALIIPFAQKDMAQAFMEGITPGYQAYLRKGFHDLLAENMEAFVEKYVPDESRKKAQKAVTRVSKAATEKFMKSFEDYRREKYVDPVMGAVSALPKEEMAAMAEALVDLTSLRRKVDSQLDTVGGPIDVAVISKGDGFIWIKRKHYFQPEINPDFSGRRKLREGGIT